jgi:chemotaxis signal transduction protein
VWTQTAPGCRLSNCRGRLVWVSSLLEWKGIEATEKLATSSNAKVVVIGNSKNGLPLILGADK